MLLFPLLRSGCEALFCHRRRRKFGGDGGGGREKAVISDDQEIWRSYPLPAAVTVRLNPCQLDDQEGSKEREKTILIIFLKFNAHDMNPILKYNITVEYYPFL